MGKTARKKTAIPAPSRVRGETDLCRANKRAQAVPSAVIVGMPIAINPRKIGASKYELGAMQETAVRKLIGIAAPKRRKPPGVAAAGMPAVGRCRRRRTGSRAQ